MTAFKAVKYLADIGRIVAVSCSAGSDDLLTKRRGAPGAVTLRHVYRVISHFRNFCDECTAATGVRLGRHLYHASASALPGLAPGLARPAPAP